MRLPLRYLTRPNGLVMSCARRLLPGRKYGPKDTRKTFVLFAVIVILSYYLFTTLTMPVRFLFINENVDRKCIIPDLDPWDKSIMKYVWSPDPIQCDPLPDLVFVDDQGLLQYNKSALSLYGSESYTCRYAILNRRFKDDYSVDFSDDVEFTPPVQVPGDFFRVTCWDKGQGKVYSRLHESVYKDKVVKSKVIADEEDPKYSVLMFGIDSTSRLAAIRKLPKTYEYLTKELGAFVMKGYMKVGDNTFPNVVPILSGKRPFTEDIPIPQSEYKSHPADIFPLIWKNFSARNYVTLFAEDYPDIHLFDVEAGGFTEPPTDHYMRPWMLGMKKVAFTSTVLKSVLLPFEYNNINLKKTSSLCFGNKPVHNYLISYYKHFVQMYRGKAKFAFSWLAQICHEFVNYLELGDGDFHSFIKFLKDDGHLRNSFLMFISDHGSRIDDIRNTFVGRIEERMPFISIVPPDNFKSKYPVQMKHLKDNTEVLTSNFDLHETLNDILLSNYNSDTSLKFETQSEKRGTSLFKEISKDRSCAEASIPEHFCACYGTTPVKPTDPWVLTAAQFAVSHLNLLLKSYQHICADLTLHKIHEAQVISLGLSARGEEENRWTIYKFFSKPEADKQKRFIVIFETTPGNAMFEATVNYNVDTGMEVLDDVSRTNKYGNTSICVPEKPLRRYCYCKSLLKVDHP